MLDLKPNCECCDINLAADSSHAQICTFECTFCADCADKRFDHICPNCGGDLVRRPIRTKAMLIKYPASRERFTKTHPQCLAAQSETKSDLSSELPEVINWRRVSTHITTSGQPTERQLAKIKALGVSHIINLGPHHNKGALNDEAGTEPS